jgi:uncharacterized DUF497 family protein
LVRITFDPAKRAITLQRRGLDFALAGVAFAGPHFTRRDDRRNYGEPRFVSVARLGSEMVVLVWTPRGGARRIISMRKANGREKAFYEESLAGPR